MEGNCLPAGNCSIESMFEKLAWLAGREAEKMDMVIIGLLVAIALLQVFILLKAGKNSELKLLEKGIERTERALVEQAARSREEAAASARHNREELAGAMRGFSDSVSTRMTQIAQLNKNQLEVFANQLSKLTQTNEVKLDQMRSTVEERLKLLQEDNAQKLEQMRATVDEKLQSTLEKRLGESFKVVSERLEQVHKGLGEMQQLASGVGDLKRVLTNVKTRGTWGEVQLGNILEQILTPDQYAANVVTKKGSSERVEFAIKIPAKDDNNSTIWLPIDAKFPVEDYQRLLDAQDMCDARQIDESRKALGARVKSQARELRDKHVAVPETTDFALLFLPTEGLYAEVLRQTGLFEQLQREYKVIVAGPTTLAALIHSLQVGFRTLAIEKRSSEVWSLLGAVKLEFGRFGDLLEKTQKKLSEASNTIEDAARKSRTIERRLKNVQQLPAAEAAVPGLEEPEEQP